MIDLPQVLLRVACRVLQAFVQELLAHHVVDKEEVVCVFAGVAEHFGGEGAETPICELVLLVCEDGAVVLE